MSKVLVDRELLDLLRNFTFLHDDGCAGAIRGNIDKALAAQPAEAEGVDEFGLFCANCGKPLTRDGTLVTGPGIDHEEVCCSQWCHDEHERLGCPQGEPGGSFRDAEWYGRKLSAVTAERDAANSRLHEVAVACAEAEAERDQLRAEVEALRKDSERLDRLDMECEAYGFEGIHEGNRWMIDGPFRAVRDAIDAAMAAKEA